MNIPELRLGRLIAKLPIIQGGMAVRISTAKLAAAVANEGGIGIIAATGMAPDELRKEIRLARKLSDGIIGVNVLYAVKDFALLVKTALSSGIDLLISGAGFSRDMFAWGKKAATAIVPVVASAKLANLAERLGAAAVIVEGKEAGGHLGTDKSLSEILPSVVKAVSIPVIGAGGIIDGFDIARTLKLGASGVQMGTRFAASIESNASFEMKNSYLGAEKKDVVLVPSSVGFPGRALNNSFAKRIIAGKIPIERCRRCLKKCTQRYCIMDALENASNNNLGEYDNALFFAGSGVWKIKEIAPVKEIIATLKRELSLA